MSQSPSDTLDGRSESAAVPQNDYYRLLSSTRRRLVLDVLKDRTTPIALDDVAMAIATHEERVREQVHTPEQIAITLHHNHLPKLSDAGVLDYDEASNRVESFRGLNW